MAYSTELEKRIDVAAVALSPHVSKKKMFSGLSYFIDEKICFAVRGDELMIRVDKVCAGELLKRPGMHPAVMGKRTMKNWLQAGGEAIATEQLLLELLNIGRDSTRNV